MNKGIDHGIGCEGFHPGENDTTLGEGNRNRFDCFEMGWLVAAEAVAGTRGKETEAKGEEEIAHFEIKGH